MEDYFAPYKNLARSKNMAFGSSNHTDVLLRYFGTLLNCKFCYLQKEDVLFWASDSYATKFGMNQNYSGLYRWVKLPRPDFQCRMSVRFFMDLIAGGKRDKLDIPEIDKKVTLYTNDKEYARQIITMELVEKYLALPKELTPAEVVINPDYIPEMKGHEAEQLVGLEVKRWYSVEELQQYWEVVERFLSLVTFPVCLEDREGVLK